MSKKRECDGFVVVGEITTAVAVVGIGAFLILTFLKVWCPVESSLERSAHFCGRAYPRYDQADKFYMCIKNLYDAGEVR